MKIVNYSGHKMLQMDYRNAISFIRISGKLIDMKPRIFIFYFALLCSYVASAQSPFKKGTLNFSNRPNLSYSGFKSLVNGDPKSFDFRIDPSYFIVDGVAIGVEFRTGSNSSKNAKSSFSSWQSNLTLTYGRPVTGRLNAYIKLFAGPGRSNSEFDISTNGNNPQKLAATYFDIKGLIGLPVALTEGGSAYFTPYVSYDKYKTKTSTNNFTDKTIAFGFKLESYIGKGQFANAKERDLIYSTAYKQGSHFLEFNTIGGISSNTRQQYQVGSTVRIAPQKITSVNLGIGYNYYVIDNIAVGLNFSVSSTKTGYKGAGSSTNSTLMITPVVTAHAPVEGAAHNLFLQASYGFGTYKAPKKNLRDLSVKAGYNIFLNRFLTLTPKIGYERASANVPQGVSGIPYTNKGVVAEMGVRTWLNFWKWK